MSGNPARPKLTADLTLYFAPATGDDANDGLTPLTPLATMRRVRNVIDGYDLDGFTVHIQVAAGSYKPGWLSADQRVTSAPHSAPAAPPAKPPRPRQRPAGR